MKRATFLYLNGTLVMPIKPQSLSETTLIEGAAQAIARLSRAGFLCPIVTIQSRIAKGVFSEEDFRRWFANLSVRLRNFGAAVVGPYVCPQRFRGPCECKKPAILLHELAASEHGIDLRQSFVIGSYSSAFLVLPGFLTPTNPGTPVFRLWNGAMYVLRAGPTTA